MGKSSIEMVVCNFKISLISDRHMDIEPPFLVHYFFAGFMSDNTNGP